MDARIERERNNLAELVVKEGAAAEGDTVVIDFVGSIDGVEFDGGDNFSRTWFRVNSSQVSKTNWLDLCW